MSDKTVDQPRARNSATSGMGFSLGLTVILAIMVWFVVVSIAYAIAMIRFLGDGGWFLAYGSLCDVTPVMASLDRFLPFLVAGIWIGAIYLAVTRSPRFRRFAITASLLSIAYGAVDIVLGPFTFRVGPAGYDPATLTCGRWPREITQSPDLAVMQIDWLGMPISVFGLSLVLLSLTIYVVLRLSKRIRLIYSAR